MGVRYGGQIWRSDMGARLNLPRFDAHLMHFFASENDKLFFKAGYLVFGGNL